MIKFEVDKIYYMISPCNSDVVWEYKVVSRTAKTVTLRESGVDAPSRFRISEYDGYEMIYPLGKYSMCPILKAVREVKPELPDNVVNLDDYRKLKEVI